MFIKNYTMQGDGKDGDVLNPVPDTGIPPTTHQHQRSVGVIMS
jgi:hypothetical protein